MVSFEGIPRFIPNTVGHMLSTSKERVNPMAGLYIGEDSELADGSKGLNSFGDLIL